MSNCVLDALSGEDTEHYRLYTNLRVIIMEKRSEVDFRNYSPTPFSLRSTYNYFPDLPYSAQIFGFFRDGLNLKCSTTEGASNCFASASKTYLVVCSWDKKVSRSTKVSWSSQQQRCNNNNNKPIKQCRG